MSATAGPASGRLLIAGARVADGTGSPLRDADVLIDAGRIIAVQPRSVLPERGEWRLIRADGLVLAPGFIDVHSHADLSPLLQEDDTTKIMQGVTTEVVGNCGSSPAPLLPATKTAAKATAGRLFPDIPSPWYGFGEFLGVTDAAGYVTNYCPLVGHGALRAAVLGAQARAVTKDELGRMKDLLALALSDGAFGVSSGLIYPPGVFSNTDELVGLASVMQDSGIYATHMRNEADNLMQSLSEAIAVGEGAGCKVQISHLKSSGRANWGRSTAAVEFLDATRARGLRVTQDLYPYTAASTTLTACLPPWLHSDDEETLLSRLCDASTLIRIQREIETNEPHDWENLIFGAGYDGIMIASTASHEFEGQTLAQIADRQRTSPFDALVAVLRAERLDASMIEFSMAERDIETIMGNPWTIIASDGLPTGSGGKPHPRLYGTFPRVLGRYVRERRLLGLPEAIRKMTALPADVFGIEDRGRIEIGAVADLVAFSAAEVSDVGDYQDPIHSPAGIRWVMQNGHVVVKEGMWLGVRRGTRLLPRN